MGVRDQLERVAAWFGFGVDEDDYYEEEEEEGRRYASKGVRYGAAAEEPASEPSPAVRRLGRAERSSAFGTSLGDLFGSENSQGRERPSSSSSSTSISGSSIASCLNLFLRDCQTPNAFPERVVRVASVSVSVSSSTISISPFEGGGGVSVLEVVLIGIASVSAVERSRELRRVCLFVG